MMLVLHSFMRRKELAAAGTLAAMRSWRIAAAGTGGLNMGAEAAKLDRNKLAADGHYMLGIFQKELPGLLLPGEPRQGSVCPG